MSHNNDRIILQGVRTHNLKDIDVQIPKNQITTITGVSGSGKSSLAFETIYKEGQFRYIESLSSYLRNFFSLGTRPEMDYSEGLSPAIAIEQNKRVANSRSSVGTITELDDYLRLLLTKCGNAYCYKCGTAMKPKNTEQILDEIRAEFMDEKVYLLQEMKSHEEQADLAKFVRKNRKLTDAGEGITRYLLGTNRNKEERTYKNLVEYFYLEEPNVPHDAFPVQIFGIFDRIQITEQTLGRLREDSIKMLSRTEKFGVKRMESGTSAVESDKKENTNSPLVKEGLGEIGDQIHWYTDKYYCPRDNISYPEFTTQHFSPNRQEGACPTCHGIGEQLQVDFDKVLDPNAPYINAILPWRDSNLGQAILKKLAMDYKFDEQMLWKDVPLEYREVVLHGDGELHKINTGGDKFTSMYYKGVEDVLTSQYQKGVLTVDFQAMLDLKPCHSCHGARLRQESLNVFLEVDAYTSSLSDQGTNPLGSAASPLSGGDHRLLSSDLKNELSLPDKGDAQRAEGLINLGNGITIELATGEDVEEIIETKKQSWIETYVNKEAKVTKKMIEERFAERREKAKDIAINQIKEHNRLYLLKDKNKIVGVKYAIHLDGDKREYGGLYILAKYHGKGYGKKLHALAMQDFVDKDIYLTVADYNSNAIGFYEKMGFEKIDGQFETTTFENGVYINAMCMVKKASEHIYIQSTFDSSLFPSKKQEVLKQVVTLLEKNNIAYQLYGGTATYIYGSQRAVNDLDFDIYSKDEKKVAKLFKAYNSKGFVKNVYPECSMSEFYFEIDGVEIEFGSIDTFIAEKSLPIPYILDYKKLYIQELGIDINIIDKDLQITLKKYFNRPQDILDLQNLDQIYTQTTSDSSELSGSSEKQRFNLHDLQRLPMAQLMETITLWKDGTNAYHTLVERITKPLLDRAATVTSLGLGYLQTTRPVDTLSGGEIQRLRLAKQLGNKLTGIIYVLDEPTIGLDTKEIENTIKAIKGLKEMGNTIIVVEHNEEFIKESDYIVEVGPGAGDFGGNLVYQGPIEDFMKQDTLTAQYMTGRKKIHIDFEHKVSDKVVRIRNAHKHNLKNVTVEFPIGGFTIITGGSGAGKTTLLHHTLYSFLEDKAKFIQSHIRLRLLKQGMSRQEIISSPIMKREMYEELEKEGIQEFYKHIGVDDITGYEHIQNVLYVDQASIGKTPRSCPATFIGLFDDIRKLYAGATEAKMLGFDAGHFSFNSKKGACPECEGYGSKHIELQFLPDTYVPCALCRGRRYKPEILSIKRHGKSIADILEMYVFDALDVFHDMNHLAEPLKLMCDIGLGYLRMGQSAHTLSGGESQRIKLVKHLLKSYRGHTAYFLDEPTVGLHPQDIERLLQVLKKFLDNGDSIMMIEHEKNLLKFADKVIWLEDGRVI